MVPEDYAGMNESLPYIYIYTYIDMYMHKLLNCSRPTLRCLHLGF